MTINTGADASMNVFPAQPAVESLMSPSVDSGGEEFDSEEHDSAETESAGEDTVAGRSTRFFEELKRKDLPQGEVPDSTETAASTESADERAGTEATVDFGVDTVRVATGCARAKAFNNPVGTESTGVRSQEITFARATVRKSTRLPIREPLVVGDRQGDADSRKMTASSGVAGGVVATGSASQSPKRGTSSGGDDFGAEPVCRSKRARRETAKNK